MSLYKQAGLLHYDYTPAQWKKFTSPEERAALSAGERRLLGDAARHPLAFSLSMVTSPAGWLAAPFTPSWTYKDAVEFGKGKSSPAQLLLPGYLQYKNSKLLGYQRGIQKRVEEKAAEETPATEKRPWISKTGLVVGGTGLLVMALLGLGRYLGPKFDKK